ncbi:hypothetical protein LTS18_012503 [Coniosporium uncinatum]|uniref:Uncharacterized protein n=1 Tax=Coniosporium uncinatum TaxID=93489 RepID=A0ACC3DWB2_9PEZI|nr:hypothetical protein LTS18_012503 [Coniosporium uncinatum]
MDDPTTDMITTEDGDIDPAIAAAMGFSSFGAQTIHKKRKYNDDSVTDVMAKPGAKTGANNTELGVRRKPDSAAADPAGALRTKGKTKQPAAPSGLAAFLAHGQTLPATSQPSTGRVTLAAIDASMPDPASTANVPTTTLPTRPSQEAKYTNLTREDLQAWKKGIKNKDGDVAYYMSSFVVNPWKS